MMLAELAALAQRGRFAEFLSACRQYLAEASNKLVSLLDVGALLSDFGFLDEARDCFQRARSLAPDDLRALVNLANLARDAGDHAESRRLYAALLDRLPDHAVIRRNALLSLEYDPVASDVERLNQARAWGDWAVARAGGTRPRPPLQALSSRTLRIGYVSADLCQHTVGLLVKDVFRAHDAGCVEIFIYSAGTVDDWVTREIRACTRFRDVRHLDDAALADRIRQDGIDVLVDLSGHTAGSRLTVFAHHPAPVQVSWLGYFATTGLDCMDAVLLDDWHAPPGTEAQFVETIIRLTTRFCYTPVPWMPTVAPAPSFTKGHITFGSFNNTAKYNAGVFDVWARVLAEVPESRLVLKWRTFNDATLRQSVASAFVARGIAADRIEIRGPSFHAEVLKEYADIDIALDPFPFTGGLTSCEALYSGVPVVTWPQSRAVSRQTYAILSAIGLPEFAARDADNYVRIAVDLANDRLHLAHLRETLRARMEASPLCDVAGFTRSLEDRLIALFDEIALKESNKVLLMTPKTLLNVGAGHPNSGAGIPSAFQGPEWKEVRLDIDPANEPDILGTMLDMSAVADGSVDAIYSSHNIEHLYPGEIPLAMQEFLRVLRSEGFAVITCPDLQAAARMIAEDRLMEVAYNSPGGAVTPFDIVYSHRQFTGRDKPYMAHHCGFTLKVLIGTLKANGFLSVVGKRRPQAFDLWVVATKGSMEDDELRALAERVLPV
jgi:predicted O-linked N-acetylglucosamine transferase (SPINDLY family)/predicted SAM-dependent methyltransferase